MQKSLAREMKFALGMIALLASATAASRPAHADTPGEVIQITSDAYPGRVSNITLMTDEQGDVTTLSYSDGGSPKVYDLNQLREGVVVVHNASPSRDVVILKLSGSFNSQHGGELNINYLTNGLMHPHGYNSFIIELVRNGASWLSYSVSISNDRARTHERADHPFSSLHFVANHMFGQPVGVSYIQTN